MNKTNALQLLLLSLVLSACASQPTLPPAVRYEKPETVKVPQLEPELRQHRQPIYCRKLLQIFSTSQLTTDSLCGTTIPSLTDMQARVAPATPPQ